jgi:hypothetical protein
VHEFAPEVFETFDLGPIPFASIISECIDKSMRYSLEETGTIDQHIAFIIDDMAALFNLHFPFSGFLVPNGVRDAGVILDIPLQIPLYGGVFHVLPDLRT